MATVNYYPPSPVNVPPELTATNRRYRNRIIIVLASLFLFFLLYVALVAGSAYVAYWAWTFPVKKVDRGTVLMKVVAIGASGLLFLFLFKGFFKWRRPEQNLRIEITEEEQPRLFEFIYHLCEETGAPYPKRVFLTPDVNAAVFYNESILSLFLPTRKNLLIGLGLVNALNLSEFKAVLAHEFGHFSQKSMKLGGYVYTSNRVIGDMVYGRDYFDDLLNALKGTDIRLAVFVYGFQGVIWVLRKGLEGCFQVINFSNAALSREMEFQADLVAVSVTGSDALIHALSRLELADQGLTGALEDLRHAADHNLYTRDLFAHQQQNFAYIRKLRDNPQLGLPPVLPSDPNKTVQVFEDGDGGIPHMWATHPSNFDREKNAKQHYIRSVLDERTPWCLFMDPGRLRQRLTACYYELAHPQFKESMQTDASRVQAFIDDERAETTYDAAYHSLYDNRYVELDQLDDLVGEARRAPWRADQLSAARSDLYGNGLKDWIGKHNIRLAEYNLLEGLDKGELQVNGKHFEFRGQQAGSRDVKHLLDQVNQELEGDQKWLAEHDRKAFVAHYQMAAQLGDRSDQQLLDRYRFHLGLQGLLRPLLGEQAQVNAALAYVSNKSTELAPEEFQEMAHILGNARDALEYGQREAERLLMPEMKHMQAGQSLGRFLFARPLVHPINQTSIEGQWIGKLLEQLGEVIDRAKRIHFKSLGGILLLQEAIHTEWAARMASGRPASV